LIAADTSSLVAYLDGQTGADVEMLQDAFERGLVCLPPPVVTELRSGLRQNAKVARLIAKAPQLPIADGFWERAGKNRRLLLSKGRKAKLADALIAQCCIDAGVPLIARDGDYRHFAQWCGLKLAE